MTSAHNDRALQLHFALFDGSGGCVLKPPEMRAAPRDAKKRAEDVTSKDATGSSSEDVKAETAKGKGVEGTCSARAKSSKGKGKAAAGAKSKSSAADAATMDKENVPAGQAER